MKVFGSLVLFEANSLEEVREKIEQDLYWTSGVVSLVLLALRSHV